MPEDTESWSRHFQVGRAHGAAAEYPEAESSLRRAIRIAPHEPYPHYELGYTLFLMGRYEEALSEYMQTEALVEGFFLVQREIYVCREILDGGIDGETVEMLQALQQQTDAGAERTDQAVALSQRVIERAPRCALGYFFMGKSLLQESPQLAEEHLRRCLELRPDDTTAIDAKSHLGLLLSRSDRASEARQIWDAILADYPNHPHVALVRGMVG